MKNIWSYTPPGNEYPPYVSINETERGDVEITVRAPKKPPDGGRDYAMPGDTAAITIPRSEFLVLLQSGFRYRP